MVTTITLGKRNRRTNLQLAQEAMQKSAYADKRLTDHREDDTAKEVGLVARFSFAEDFQKDEAIVTVDISSRDGELYAELSTDGEAFADSSGFIQGDSWADM